MQKLPKVWEEYRYETIAILICLTYIGFFSYFSIVQHYNFLTQKNDLWIMERSIAAAASGDFLMAGRFAHHNNFIFYLIAPLYKVFPHSEFLLVLISFGCGLAGLGLYFVAKIRLDSALEALIPAILFWLAPVVHYANLYDFHVICLATMLFIWAYYFYLKEQFKTAFCFFVLFLLCKEELAYVGLFWGLFIYQRGSRRWGISAAGLSLFFLVVISEYVVPNFLLPVTQKAGAILADRYEGLGSSPAGVFVGIFANPSLVFNLLIDLEKWRPVGYFLLLGTPWLFRSWLILLCAAPHLGMALLAKGVWPSHVIGTYYWIFVQIVLLIAFVDSMARFKDAGWFKWAALYIMTAGILSSVVYSPMPFGIFSKGSDLKVVDPGGREDLAEMVETVPSGATVGTQANLVPHILGRFANYSLISKNMTHFLLRLKHELPFNFCFYKKLAPEHLFYRDYRGHFDFLFELARSERWRIAKRQGFFYLFERGDGRNDPLKGSFLVNLNHYVAGFSRAANDFNDIVPKFFCKL